MVQEFFCQACEGYAIVEVVKPNKVRVTVCYCQELEEENATV